MNLNNLRPINSYIHSNIKNIFRKHYETPYLSPTKSDELSLDSYNFDDAWSNNQKFNNYPIDQNDFFTYSAPPMKDDSSRLGRRPKFPNELDNHLPNNIRSLYQFPELNDNKPVWKLDDLKRNLARQDLYNSQEANPEIVDQSVFISRGLDTDQDLDSLHNDHSFRYIKNKQLKLGSKFYCFSIERLIFFKFKHYSL